MCVSIGCIRIYIYIYIHIAFCIGKKVIQVFRIQSLNRIIVLNL